MAAARPYALTIAGFDPSGGAGIAADVKTFESHKVQGLSVVTGITFQNEDEFTGVKWMEMEEIEKQVKVLTKKYTIGFLKIGLVKDLDMVLQVAALFKGSDAKIVWDPILKASAGFEVHKNVDKKKAAEVCKKVYLITPNTSEAQMLTGEKDELKAAKALSSHCHVLLKGGHSEKAKGKDRLFMQEGKQFSFNAKRVSGFPKHGSGCVLSAAITAQLARGNNLQRSCLAGKQYVEKVLWSNKTLLGYHKL